MGVISSDKLVVGKKQVSRCFIHFLSPPLFHAPTATCCNFCLSGHVATLCPFLVHKVQLFLQGLNFKDHKMDVRAVSIKQALVSV